MSRPAVCFGSPSPEHDISVLTGLQAIHALTSAGAEPISLYWAKTGDWYQVPATLEAVDFADGLPKGAEPVTLLTGSAGGFHKVGRRAKTQLLDIVAVVNCCHGVPGEDGTLQAMFDLAGVRYTGPSQWGAAIGMDKLAFSAAMASAGVPSLPTWGLTESSTAADVPVSGPLIVKPRFGGSSLGIEIVEDLETAVALVRTQPLLKEGAVVQRYLVDAVDLNISVKTCPERAYSVVEKPLRSPDGHIYTYVEKYLEGETAGMASAAREMPAVIAPEIEAKLRSYAEKVMDVALVRSVARIDFLLDGDNLFVNEINTTPGSLSWYFWAHDGIPFAGLLQQMLLEASAGPTRQLRTDGADGVALRSAGAMARKLA